MGHKNSRNNIDMQFPIQSLWFKKLIFFQLLELNVFCVIPFETFHIQYVHLHS